MKRKETNNRNWEERIDPDANPLTSFGRDDEFTEELIKGVCEKTGSVSVTSKENGLHSGLRNASEGLEGNGTGRNQRQTRKIRKGIA